MSMRRSDLHEACSVVANSVLANEAGTPPDPSQFLPGIRPKRGLRGRMGTPQDRTRVSESVSLRGRTIYEEGLKASLEAEQRGRFVAIEPDTGRYFLGDHGAEALVAAHQAMPGSEFYLKRIGFDMTYKLCHS